MSQLFSQLPLKPELKSSLERLEYQRMTPIQQQSLPAMLEGHDMLAQAQTGSGKTAAFGLALLNAIHIEPREVQALVLCPTRELAEQVSEELRRLGRSLANLRVLAVYGGEAIGPQIKSLQSGAHIVVGTPGRVQDLLSKRKLDLSLCHQFVLDEADRMLDMGFRDEIIAVSEHLPVQHQTLLFSATYPQDIEKISARLQHQPKRVRLEPVHQEHKIQQWCYKIEPEFRWQAVINLLTHFTPDSAMVFCNTKKDCAELADELAQQGFSVAELQGDMEQHQRQAALVRFSNGSATVLVATDVAARGLDISGVGLVVNAQMSANADTHIHRIGRTGRAEATGMAISLFDESERRLLEVIEDHLDQTLPEKRITQVRFNRRNILPAPYVTLQLNAGKKSKIRPGDIVGTLTQQADIPAEDLGDIKVAANHAYVAVKQRSVKRALAQFREGKVKGKRVKATKLK
ncbi:RNA helicase [Saliniradius amylolyticus]|uniref:RNA helicase n=1 Tax=Saliniradius amylolyticus TaxID=2183582 RepID=A0A2S2E612_9ALTE|nr:ATP-dependent RNA helicase DbpA [Saliniradius amylolyticus]AWL13073.1 RNA helicase [Saliniradius amylolyticus]